MLPNINFVLVDDIKSLEIENKKKEKKLSEECAERLRKRNCGEEELTFLNKKVLVLSLCNN
tara:strand:+ start:1978 stop:2160 length:183 start_codon:yes stop_codon:yes gene_type:complete